MQCAFTDNVLVINQTTKPSLLIARAFFHWCGGVPCRLIFVSAFLFVIPFHPIDKCTLNAHSNKNWFGLLFFRVINLKSVKFRLTQFSINHCVKWILTMILFEWKSGVFMCACARRRVYTQLLSVVIIFVNWIVKIWYEKNAYKIRFRIHNKQSTHHTHALEY